LKKKSFTLVEIIIAIIILGVLATIAYPLYQNTIENAKVKVCETNLKAIEAAIEIYGLENDEMPGSISKLRPEHLRKAWAKVLKEENPWIIKFSYLIIDLEKGGFAYAQDNFFQRYLGGEIKLITCPKDKTPPQEIAGAIFGVSYGINERIAGKSYSVFKNLAHNTIIVADCESKTFRIEKDLAKRHKRFTIKGIEKIAIGINKGKKANTFR